MLSPLEARVRVLGVDIFKYDIVVGRKMSRGQNVERHFKKSLQWKWMVFKKWLLLKNSIRRLLDESTDSSEKKSNIVFFSFDFYFSKFFPVKKNLSKVNCVKSFLKRFLMMQPFEKMSIGSNLRSHFSYYLKLWRVHNAFLCCRVLPSSPPRLQFNQLVLDST